MRVLGHSIRVLEFKNIRLRALGYKGISVLEY